MKITSNQEILKGIVDQDDRIHQYLYDEVLPAIISYVRKNHGTIEDAEDVFQDALIAIHARLKEGPMDLNCKFSTYLYQICKNIWLKQLQRNNLFKKKRHEINETNALYPELLSDEIIDIEAYIIFQRNVNKLNEVCREIIRLRNMKVPYKDIAENLNIASESQARKLKFNCVEKLCGLIRKDPAFIELIKKKINAKDTE